MKKIYIEISYILSATGLLAGRGLGMHLHRYLYWEEL